jgi:phospholipase C
VSDSTSTLVPVLRALCCLTAITSAPFVCGCRNKQQVDPEQERAAFVRGQVPDLPPKLPVSGCRFNAGELPSATIGKYAPIGRNLPIDHFVFVMQENRSFDHYFQGFRPAPGTAVDVAPDSYAAIAPTDRHSTIKPYELLHPCPDDPAHDYESVLLSWRGGKMDGFALASGPEAVSYFSEQVLTYYHALARAFAISDRHFADFLGPTWPNRLFALSGTSFGHFDNTSPPSRDIETSLFHQLDERNLAWLVYADNRVFEEGMYPVLHQAHRDRFRSIAQFLKDAESGNLPALAWVESSYGGVSATDEHPPANVEVGQRFVHRIVDAVMRSPEWKTTLVILTYDEHGGFFDHVAPPVACIPDAHTPKPKSGHLSPRFDYLGMRVPLILISPWVRRAYVSHQTTSHTSLLRLIQARFELPALTRRDANAVPPFDMFDFASQPRLEVPDLPVPVIEPSRQKNCEAIVSNRPKRVDILEVHAKRH